ncbi:MAG: aspartate aminotransferase family protein [Bacteriovoracia bacterium]
MEMNQIDQEYFAREAEPKHIQITQAEGSYLIDSAGKRYIDFNMGWCVGNIGWNNEEINNAIKNFHGPSYVQPHFEYQPWTELAQLLAEITPGKLKKSFRATGGTEAVEIALQAAIEHTGRTKFVAIENAYHGNSIATRALTTSDFSFIQSEKIRPPLTKKSLEKVEDILSRKDIAAFIMEPVIMNLGILVPETEFMQGLQSLCKKYGTLLIMDEVASGFGRTGRMFASEYFDIEPDIMCLAKSMSGGGAGIGAAIMTEEVANSFSEENFPYSTYGWHPLGVEAAIANIRYLQTHWNELDENIQSISEYFRERIEHMMFEDKPEVTVMGLAIKMRFKDKKYFREVCQRAEGKGLLISSSGSMFPALNIDFETAKQGLDILESCL